MTQDVEALTERVEKLEKQNWRFKLLGAMVLLITSAALITCDSNPADTVIETGKLFVVDGNREKRIALEVTEDGPVFEFYDVGIKKRVRLGIFEGNPVFYLFDTNGKAQLMLTADNAGATVSFVDPDGKARVTLGTDERGGTLQFFDRGRKPRLSLGLTKEGAGLSLLNSRGKLLFSAP